MPSHTRIIAVANQKGGVGKTTTSVSLAACLAELGQHVLLVDLDPQANATSGVGVAKEDGVSAYKALLGNQNLAEVIRSTAFEHLDIIPAELDLAGAEVDVARGDNYLHRLSLAIAPISDSKTYDFIVIDCPPSLGILTMNGLAAANGLLIPIQCEYYALEGLSVITRLVEQVHDSGANPNLILEGIVMTMYDGRTNLSQQVVNEVQTHFGDLVYEQLIPRTVRLSEAPSFGQPIISYDSNGSGAQAYRALAKEVLERSKKRGTVDDTPTALPAAEGENSIDCPLCGRALRTEGLREGTTRCGICRRLFNVE